MILPGFKESTDARSVILDVAVKLAFDELEKRYPTTALSNLAAISSGGTPPKGNSAFYGGDVPWAKIGDITAASKWIGSTEETITEQGLAQSSAKLFPASTVLFSMYGSIGKTAITTRPLATNQAILGLIPKDGVSAEYLYYSLISARAKLFSEAKGTSQKNINGGMVKRFSVPTPPPDVVQAVVSYLAAFEQGKNVNALQDLPPFISEQRRIVGRLEHLAGKIEEARGLREKAESEAEVIVSAYLNRLFGNPYENEEGSLGIKTFKLLNEIVTDVADGPHKTPKYADQGIPFITVLNITSGRIEFSNHKYVTKEDHKEFSKRAKAEQGDVLISKDGTIGLPCYVSTDREFSFFVSVALVKPKHELLDGKFLAWALRAPYLQNRMRERSRGDMIRHLILREIKALNVPVPSLEEQRHIVKELDAFRAKVDSLKQLQAQTRAELDALLPSILDKAFQGKL